MIRWLILSMGLLSMYLCGYNQGLNQGYETAIKFDPICKENYARKN